MVDQGRGHTTHEHEFAPGPTHGVAKWWVIQPMHMQWHLVGHKRVTKGSGIQPTNTSWCLDRSGSWAPPQPPKRSMCAMRARATSVTEVRGQG